MLELPLLFVFYHVTKFCYVAGIRNAGGHEYSPRTRVVLMWLFLNINAGLAKTRYLKEVSACGVDPYML